MDHYLSVIRDCLEEGISPRCHLEDITRADIYGYVVPFCLELMKLMKEYQIPIKVRACDTMGYGVNYPGAVIPRSVQGIIYAIHTHAGVPHELIEWHGHNDFYKAVSNSTTAWLYGCSGVNTSPVSYTHLDVYKRQVLKPLKKICLLPQNLRKLCRPIRPRH